MNEAEEPKSKPFSKFSAVVDGIKNIEGIDLTAAIAYAKFYYEDTESIEDNLARITKICCNVTAC
jgi:hypothetical protein